MDSATAVKFSLIRSDLIAEVLSYLFTGQAINELFTGGKYLDSPSFDIVQGFACVTEARSPSSLITEGQSV
jgi:hypothetical protein